MIDLKKNNLSGIFMKGFQNCMRFDNYLNCMDLSHNNIDEESLLDFLGNNCLTGNSSYTSIDISYNPGANPKIKKQMALAMLRNISLFRNMNIKVNSEYLIKRALKVDSIPCKIYKLLGMRFKNEKVSIHDKRCEHKHESDDESDHDGHHQEDSDPIRKRKRAPEISIDLTMTSKSSPAGKTNHVYAQNNTKEEPVDFVQSADQLHSSSSVPQLRKQKNRVGP